MSLGNEGGTTVVGGRSDVLAIALCSSAGRATGRGGGSLPGARGDAQPTRLPFPRRAYDQRREVAIAAPSDSARNFSHTTLGCTSGA